MSEDKLYINREKLDMHINTVQNMARNMFNKKNGAYGEDEDALRNFRISSELMGHTMEEAVGGMMSKHTSSIYDLISQKGQGDYISLPIWREKIVDHITYLYLLWAIVAEKDARSLKIEIEGPEK